MAIHNAFVTECHEREGTNRPGRVSLDFRYELAASLIENSRTQAKASNAPRNEEFRLQNVGAHGLKYFQIGKNCAVCSKRIRKSHGSELKDVSRIKPSPVP